QKTTIESNDIRREMQEETLPIGCWQSQYFENGTIFQLKFSQDGYYKEYYGNEPKENSGTWKRITADKIQLNGKIPDRILTMEKKGDEYIMKEIYNGNPREWKKEK
ncbi:MAG: hypothetical protein PHR31_00215, partial [Candidatus Pacebacteria bacterium]|nr:hypothetical protein [Candidatus Paceibacterota bacterium]